MLPSAVRIPVVTGFVNSRIGSLSATLGSKFYGRCRDATIAAGSTPTEGWFCMSLDSEARPIQLKNVVNYVANQRSTALGFDVRLSDQDLRERMTKFKPIETHRAGARGSRWPRRASLCLRLALACAVAGELPMLPATAHAQSAGDKATARQLATAGIKFYQQSQYDEALDKLKRAQALYEAPVHLLYIARCQVKLGQLVEGAESYRKLVRTELDASAPDVFRSAVADGEKELAEVEPRIPSLTISVDPSSAAGLEIKLDGEPVSSAVLGVERPVNPGERTVTAEAPGFLTAEASTSLAEGEKKQLSLTLVVDPNAPKEAEPSAATPPGELRPEAASPDSWREREIDPGAVGFFLGLSVGGLFPSGNLEEDASTTDFMSTGGGGEVHGGVRFLKNFGVKLFFERYALLPGKQLDAAPAGLPENTQYEVTSTAHVTSFGLSAIAGTERGRIGGYGELGFALLHEYGWDRDLVDTDRTQAPDFDACTESTAYSGGAFRIGGAFVFPVHWNVQLTATAVATLGTFRNQTLSSNCKIDGAAAPGDVEEEVKKTGFHQQFYLGFGGDFLFGPG